MVSLQGNITYLETVVMRTSESSPHHYGLHSVQLCGCKSSRELELTRLLILAASSLPPPRPPHRNISYLLLLAPYISSIGRSAYFLNISETPNFLNHSLILTLNNLLIPLEQNSSDPTPFHAFSLSLRYLMPSFSTCLPYKNPSFLPTQHPLPLLLSSSY